MAGVDIQKQEIHALRFQFRPLRSGFHAECRKPKAQLLAHGFRRMQDNGTAAGEMKIEIHYFTTVSLARSPAREERGAAGRWAR